MWLKEQLAIVEKRWVCSEFTEAEEAIDPESAPFEEFDSSHIDELSQRRLILICQVPARELKP